MIGRGFSVKQRRELHESRRLLPAHVDDLESVALPTMRAVLRRQPTKVDARTELGNAANALRSAEDAVCRLLSLTVSIKSWHYAHLFILHMRNDGCKPTV